jgi:hypothetical protein
LQFTERAGQVSVTFGEGGGGRAMWSGLFGLLLIALLAAALLLAPTPRRASAITRENFDRIQVGMTKADVEAILGGPPGKYTDRPDPVDYHGISFRHWWIGDEAVITIEMWGGDADRRVYNKTFTPYPAGSFADRCRSILSW